MKTSLFIVKTGMMMNAASIPKSKEESKSEDHEEKEDKESTNEKAAHSPAAGADQSEATFIRAIKSLAEYSTETQFDATLIGPNTMYILPPIRHLSQN